MKKASAAAVALLVAVGIAAKDDGAPPDARGKSVSSSSPTTAPPRAPEVYGTAVPEAPVPTTQAPRPIASRRPAAAGAAPMLFASSGGDGDSWRDDSGREYRLGLVNAPETHECYGSQATARRKALVAGGFRVRTYTTDRYGRGVSVVTLPDGRNLNVLLAREGYVDDRYLQRYRHEQEALAVQLDAAFAAAKRDRVGLWGACRSEQTQPVAAPAPAPAAEPASGCHPDYKTCIPVRGDGSGRGDANDLDCGQIGKPVVLRRIGVDPYGLDRDRDGVGCDS